MKPKRRHILLAGAALLYLGAVLAAAAGAGPAAIPVILGFLMLYTVLMRPAGQWSGSGPAGAARLALAVGVLALVAALLWGAGGAIAAIAGPLPLPVWAGLAVSAAGVALSRMVWSARREAEMDDFLDDALARLQGVAAGATADAAARRAAAEAEEGALWARLDGLLAALDARLGDGGAADAEIDGLARLDMTREVWQALSERAARGPAWQAARFAFLGHPAIRPWEVFEEDVLAALEAAVGGGDAALGARALAAVDAWAGREGVAIAAPAALADAVAALPARTPAARAGRNRLAAGLRAAAGEGEAR